MENKTRSGGLREVEISLWCCFCNYSESFMGDSLNEAEIQAENAGWEDPHLQNPVCPNCFEQEENDEN